MTRFTLIDNLPVMLIAAAWAMVPCTLALPMSMPMKDYTAITHTVFAVAVALHVAAIAWLWLA